MKELKGDLLNGDWDIAVHVANNFKTFGSGIAHSIKKRFPEVYQADLDYDPNNILLVNEEKLGTFSKATLSNGRTIYNLYAMRGLGNDGSILGRNTSYDAFHDGLFRIIGDAKDVPMGSYQTLIIGIPKYVGCCRAGGSWRMIQSILQEMEILFDVEFRIYELENAELKASSTIPL